MKCPVCDIQLSISSREGVEIDYCSQCRGVWLDRGELDKIIDRAATILAPASAGGSGTGGGPQRDDWSQQRSDRGRDEDRYYDTDERHGHKRKKRRGSFLEDMFDFG